MLYKNTKMLEQEMGGARVAYFVEELKSKWDTSFTWTNFASDQMELKLLTFTQQ